MGRCFLKIVVLVKHVPDTETKIRLAGGGKSLDESEFSYMLNPYDEFAVEEAIKTQQKFGGESVVISMGPARVQESLRKSLAMGIDRAIWVNTEGGPAYLDSWCVANALTTVLKAEAPDIVFCGQKAIDDDTSHIGPMVGELMGIPHVQVVAKLEWQEGGKKALVEREVEGGMVEVYEVGTPVILGAHKSLNTPRFPTVPNIMKAKKKPMDEKKVGDVLSVQPLVEIRGFQLPPEKAPGKVFKGEPVETMVARVVQLLRTEAKVL